jgi:hypothetical protein
VFLIGSGLDDDYKHDGVSHQPYEVKEVLNLFPEHSSILSGCENPSPTFTQADDRRKPTSIYVFTTMKHPSGIDIIECKNVPCNWPWNKDYRLVRWCKYHDGPLPDFVREWDDMPYRGPIIQLWRELTTPNENHNDTITWQSSFNRPRK